VKYAEQDYHNVETGGIKVILNWVLYIDYVNLLQENKRTLTPKLYFCPLLQYPWLFEFSVIKKSEHPGYI
jgi:hypothetical protein